MKFKDLFEKKNLTRIMILAIAVFLALPLIFPEETEIKVIRKESVYPHEDSPLPIFPKESLLDKYTNKFKKFYHVGVPSFNSPKKNINQTTKDSSARLQPEIIDETEVEVKNGSADIEINAGDLFFSADYDDEENNLRIANAESTTPNDEDDSVNLNKGTVLTRDGMLLEPTQEGYYYKSKFYKNGTYPPDANKGHIEGALSRYHSRIAKNLGKKALYLADNQGNLTVSYVDSLPDESSTDIYTYLAKNSDKYQKVKTSKNAPSNRTNDQYNSYLNSKATNLNNEPIDNTDILLASIKNMHAAYNLLTNKIQSGQLGQGILPNPANLIPFGNIILDQTAVAQPPIENPEDDIYCKGNECDNSFRVAPIVTDVEGLPASDLDAFYHSLCLDTCPYSQTYSENPDKPLDLDISNNESIETLKEEIAKSDKKIVEVSYINPSTGNEELLSSLHGMSLTNKNGESVEIKLRGIEEITPDASFGDKMIGPYKASIQRDLSENENNVSYETLVERYNEVNEKAQDRINGVLDGLYSTELYPNFNIDLPIAFVEKDPEDGYFIINNSDIPKGYLTEIPQWAAYKQEDGSYRVSREVLFNPPDNLAIIAVREDIKKSIVMQNGHPVKVISKENLQNLNFDNVNSTRFEMTNAQIATVLYNMALNNENNTNK